MNFTSILMSVFWLQRAEFQRTWLFASNAHAYRLYIFKDRSREFLLYFRLAAISEALNSSSVFSVVAIKFLRSFQHQRSASLSSAEPCIVARFFNKPTRRTSPPQPEHQPQPLGQAAEATLS
ncbi:hypothetical protein F3K36_26920 [Delftia sp. BR1]|nr:hypothetical protein F3K36_26920 [Delftia sp. BR1]